MSQSGVGTTTTSLGGPSRRHRDMSEDVNPNSISSCFGDTEWEAKESQRQRELEEARARAAQMEKTMKWWSDCTANWREKWSKVRNERNKARDEAKQLRANLEASIKESNSYRREKNDLEMQISQLKNEMEKIHIMLMKHAGQFHNTCLANEDTEVDISYINCFGNTSLDGPKNINTEDGLITKGVARNNVDSKNLNLVDFALENVASISNQEYFIDEKNTDRKSINSQESKENFNADYLLQKISVLQLQLDEAQKSILIEREEKKSLYINIEKTTLELQEMRKKHEELQNAKQEAVRDFLTLQEQHRAELRILNNTLQDEQSSRDNLERRLCELRAELEKMQAENTSEWGKRERLETEKLSLERDNKKLKCELRDLQERLDKKGGQPVSNADVELHILQQELSERNKEIGDIKHSHGKLKKLLAEANTELSHVVRRAEQYETEVKRLRSRVEELKRQLAGAEDELDAACDQVRRLQQTNKELTSRTEGLEIQTS